MGEVDILAMEEGLARGIEGLGVNVAATQSEERARWFWRERVSSIHCTGPTVS